MQILNHNLKDSNISEKSFHISRDEILDVFIELMDNWVDLDLSGFTKNKNDNTISFNEHVEHKDGFKIYPL